MGLVIHVVHQVSRNRTFRPSEADRDDLVAEVFLEFVANDFAVLRHFRGQSSLATYLTVVARRVVIRTITRLGSPVGGPSAHFSNQLDADIADPHPEAAAILSDQDQVERLLAELEGRSGTSYGFIIWRDEATTKSVWQPELLKTALARCLVAPVKNCAVSTRIGPDSSAKRLRSCILLTAWQDNRFVLRTNC